MDKDWEISQKGKLPKLNRPVMVEGLPGIGNVGKVSVDFLIDELKAVKIYEINSYHFPNSVFVNEDNLVELPIIEVFYKKFNDKRNDIILVGGDVQPVDEASSYEFSDKLLELFRKLNGNEVITLGGIGLGEIPKKPRVFCTGNSKDIIKKYSSDDVNSKLYGVVGPIMGVSGLLVGIAGKHDLKAASLLAETYGHPLYLGIKGAKEILKVLNSKLKLGINLDKLDQEIKNVEAEIIKKTEQLSEVSKAIAIKKLGKKLGSETDYIG